MGLFSSSKPKVEAHSLLTDQQEQVSDTWGRELIDVNKNYDPSVTSEQAAYKGFLGEYPSYARDELSRQKTQYDQAASTVWDPQSAQDEMMRNYRENIIPQFENTYMPKALESMNKYGGFTGKHSTFDNTIAREYSNIYNNMRQDSSNLWQDYRTRLGDSQMGSEDAYRTALQNLLGQEPNLAEQSSTLSRQLLDQKSGAHNPFMQLADPYLPEQSIENIVTVPGGQSNGWLGAVAGAATTGLMNKYMPGTSAAPATT